MCRLAATYAEVLEGYQLPQSELAQNQANVEALVALRDRRLQMKGEKEMRLLTDYCSQHRWTRLQRVGLSIENETVIFKRY